MRLLSVPLLALALFAWADAQPAGKDKEKTSVRYRVEADLERYPQKTPKEALASALKALGDKRIDYLLAHLADPAFVQAKLKGLKGQLPASLTDDSKELLAFQRLVKATTEHFAEDPTKIRELARFAKDGEWDGDEKLTLVTLKTLPGRKVYLKKVDGLWRLQDRDK
jgi:hypothetical protein